MSVESMISVHRHTGNGDTYCVMQNKRKQSAAAIGVTVACCSKAGNNDKGVNKDRDL